MGMALLIYDPYVGEIDVEEFGVKKALSLKELMSDSDFVSCHLKVTPETEGCISREMLSCMKPTAYFINASRSAILDEQALVDVLRERKIAGAALDVYEKEPIDVSDPLLELDNILLMPHHGGVTVDLRSMLTRELLLESKGYVDDGIPLKNEISPSHASKMSKH
jgi:D-3-phosphoglycerate dehydrogenase